MMQMREHGHRHIGVLQRLEEALPDDGTGRNYLLHTVAKVLAPRPSGPWSGHAAANHCVIGGYDSTRVIEPYNSVRHALLLSVQCRNLTIHWLICVSVDGDATTSRQYGVSGAVVVATNSRRQALGKCTNCTASISKQILC